MRSLNLAPSRRALGVAAIYVALGVLWIVFSDAAVESLATDPAALSRMQQWKGWAFVVATGVMVYLLVVSALRAERRLQEELRRAESALRHSQKLQALGDLTSGVAHDFKNALSVITTNGELVRSTLPPESEAAAAMADVLGASEHAARLVRTLLGVARQRDLSPVPLALDALLAEEVPMLQRLLSSRYEVELVRDGSAWGVRADPDAVKQQLLNLVTNARDAMPDGGRITLRLRAPVTDIAIPDHTRPPLHCYGIDGAPARGPWVVLEVSDEGSGITDGERERLFEPFHTTKPVGVGTGLGLSMVLGLMRQQGGFVTLRTEPGRGSSFGLVFPAHAAAAAPTRQLAPPEPVPAEPDGALVLLVDDQPELRRTASRVLRRLGYRVLEAADGEEGLAAYRREGEAIALVITDQIMPRMEGTAMIAALRDAGATMPILLTSGGTLPPEESTDGALRDVARLPKPWTIADLTSGVGEAMRGRRV